MDDSSNGREDRSRGHKRNASREADEEGGEEEHEGGGKRQRPRLQSTIAMATPAAALVTAAGGLPRSLSPAGRAGDPGPERWDPHDASVVHRPAVRQVDIQPDNMKRNRRMFGALMGHLGVARKNLEKDSSIKTQEAVESTVTQKNRSESERIVHHYRAVTQDERERVGGLI
jgi:hypothetical protein